MRRRQDVTAPNARPKPRPEQFGLPAWFSATIYNGQKVQFESRRNTIAAWWTFFLFVASQGFLWLIYDGIGWNPELVVLTAAPPMCAGVIWAINRLVKPRIGENLRKHLVSMGTRELNYLGTAQPYIDAMSEWSFTQTEAGLGYWRGLKALEFERAVAYFFRRRGGIVQMTKVTGDGGVDIILQLGSTTYWCQCKGYAKPVAVAAIRQIAGATMKSGGSATPVMFSTNGYTKPALEEAATLGVICIDGIGLSQMAQRSVIASIA